jgi:hypothetical protein
MKQRLTLGTLMVVLVVGLAACGGGGEAPTQAPSGGGGGTGADGAIIISGDLQHTMQPDTQRVTVENNGFEDIIQLYFNEGTQRVVTVSLPLDIDSGEHSIATNDVTGLYLDNSGEANAAFLSISGTLTLQREGNNFSGSYIFQAQEAVAEGTARTVTVAGRFSGMALPES